MPEPRELRIVQHLQTTLQAITTGGGYFFTVPSGAVKLDPDHEVDALIQPDGPRPFVVLELDEERFTYRPSLMVDILFPVKVHWVGQAPDEQDVSLLQTYFRGAADVEQAIAADITRGGLAQDTRIVGRDIAIRGREVRALVDLEMLVHRNYGQPNG